MKHALAAAAVVLGVGFGGQAIACTVPRITIDPLWLINHGSTAGITNFWVGAEVSLFPPTVLTECTAGIGLQGPAVPSLQVHDVMVGIANLAMPGVGTTLTAFSNLQPSPAATNALGAAVPGATWFGFSGLVSPFTPPPLLQGDVFKLWFDVFVADAEVGTLLANTANFGAGTTTDPLHPLAFSGGKPLADAMMHGVPEPASLPTALLALGLAALAMRKSGARTRG